MMRNAWSVKVLLVVACIAVIVVLAGCGAPQVPSQKCTAAITTFSVLLPSVDKGSSAGVSYNYTTTAAESTFAVFLSQDASLSSDDKLLKVFSSSSGASQGVWPVPIPVDTASGAYYFIGVAEGSGGISDTCQAVGSAAVTVN